CRSPRHINQMEQDFRLQGAFEVGDQIRRQMKSHSVGIEKAQAVAIPVEVCDGNRGPVVLLILRTIRRQRTLVGIIVETSPLAKADALTEDDPGESGPDQVQDASLVLSHGTQHTASLAAEFSAKLPGTPAS